MKLRVLPVIVLTLLAAMSPVALAQKFTPGKPVPLLSELKPGDYIWHPELSPDGPVVIVVSIPDQVMYVYRNGIRIGRSTVSSGKPGHRTPTGVFTILEKQRQHTSNIYKGASMPNMQRLTWGGVALHAGNLPGYPASHGCIRLPLDFSKLLYTVTTRGTTVIVADNKSAPAQTVHPGILFAPGGVDAEAPVSPEGYSWAPERSTNGPVSILVSSADRRVYVFRNGTPIGNAGFSLEDPTRPLGNHAYSALDVIDSEGRRKWLSIATDDGRQKQDDVHDLMKRGSISPEFVASVRAVLSPGATLLITDAPVNGNTMSAPGFNILTTASK
jgi:DNA-binding beta-propeller fold protein YncE